MLRGFFVIHVYSLFNHDKILSKSSFYFEIFKSVKSGKSRMVNSTVSDDRKLICENMQEWDNSTNVFCWFLSIEDETHKSLTMFNEVCSFYWSAGLIMLLESIKVRLSWSSWGGNADKSMFITGATLKTDAQKQNIYWSSDSIFIYLIHDLV